MFRFIRPLPNSVIQMPGSPCSHARNARETWLHPSANLVEQLRISLTTYTCTWASILHGAGPVIACVHGLLDAGLSQRPTTKVFPCLGYFCFPHTTLTIPPIYVLRLCCYGRDCLIPPFHIYTYLLMWVKCHITLGYWQSKRIELLHCEIGWTDAWCLISDWS